MLLVVKVVVMIVLTADADVDTNTDDDADADDDADDPRSDGDCCIGVVGVVGVLMIDIEYCQQSDESLVIYSPDGEPPSLPSPSD